MCTPSSPLLPVCISEHQGHGSSPGVCGCEVLAMLKVPGRLTGGTRAGEFCPSQVVLGTVAEAGDFLLVLFLPLK